MIAIKGIWKHGQIVLREAADWPEDTEVVILPIARAHSLGVREEDWPDTPEAVADWLRWYASLEPLEFTPEEEADIAAWRQKTKEYTIANMSKGIEVLFE